VVDYSKDVNSDEYDGIDTENLLTLEKLKQAQRQEYIQVSQQRTTLSLLPSPTLIFTQYYLTVIEAEKRCCVQAGSLA